jgi:Arc/MetJ family transcription regulator
MRTNIVLNDELVREAMRHSKATSKRALVEEALRTFVQVSTDAERRRTYRQRLSALRDRLAGLELRQGPAELLREDRNRR